MARIAGVDIPNDKRVVIPIDLCVRYRTSNILRKLVSREVFEDIRVFASIPDQEDAIRREVDAISVEGDLFVVK